jgi:hypothetical protein
MEELIRQINPQLSLHYWDWTQTRRRYPARTWAADRPNAEPVHLGIHGYGGSTSAAVGEPWLSAGYYVPGASQHRDATLNPADPPQSLNRHVVGSPASAANDAAILAATDYANMRNLLEPVHDAMHGFVRMGGQHISFRDPFVFLLHSNVDRLFARWQTDPAHPERLDPSAVYGSESNLDVVVGAVTQNLNHRRTWSTGDSFDQFGVEHFTRPVRAGKPR